MIPAACPEGAGEGSGERRFLAAMSEPGGPAAVIDRTRRNGIRPGEQRAYVMALVLRDIAVVIAGIERPDVARAVGCVPARDVEEALAFAGGFIAGPASVLVVPHALVTLPIVQAAARTPA